MTDHYGSPSHISSIRRKILYVTGTRADFGLMSSTLHRIAEHPHMSLQLVVTGMHLSATYGLTVHDIEAEGFEIFARVPVDMEGRTPFSMSESLGHTLVGLTHAISEAKPDLLLVIGDRGEMLAAAIAAIHLGIPVVHLHGGERSGTVDEPVRHAITKLSHWHFVATEESRERVVRMGERPEHVFVTGAPSLDDLAGPAATPRAEVLQFLGLPQYARYVLVLFHPVVQEISSLNAQTQALVDALAEVLQGRASHIVWLAPNADAGSNEILLGLSSREIGLPIVRFTHLPRRHFVAATRQALALVGNSSAGIIEAASLGTPVVNIGNRQRARERNANTLDCAADFASIASALRRALDHGPWLPTNRYGDGNAGARITELLASLPIAHDLLDKVNTY